MTTTDVLGYVKASGEKYFLFGNGFTDGSETEWKIFDDGGSTKSLGEQLEGKTLEEIGVQLTDGSILGTLKVYDPQGAVIISLVGNGRSVRDLIWNMRVAGLSILLQQGHNIKVNTTD